MYQFRGNEEMQLKSLRMMSLALATLLPAAAVLADPQADLARAEEIVSGRCFLCHGMEGEAASPVFPRLAAQHPEYIAKQLADFQSGKRKSDTMKSQVEEITPAEMKALGRFFEKKSAPLIASQDTDVLPVGKYIFTKGNSFSGLPSCASCHGPKGHGTPLLPRLAGQHPTYIAEQLRQFHKRVDFVSGMTDNFAT